MWQELVAALAGLLLVAAPYWDGYASQTLLVLLNAVIAAHVLYLSLSSYAISRIENRTWRRYPQRRWLAFLAGMIAVPAVFLPPVLGLGANLVADRDNLLLGVIIFLCSMWAFLLPPPAGREEDEAEAEARSADRRHAVRSSGVPGQA